MEDLHFMRLYDLYQPLLTDTQREMTDLYFNYDLSLSEIAEQKNCSRQGVSDCLNKCRKKVEELEEKLHFSRLLTELTLKQSFLMADLSELAETLPEEIRGRLEEIFGRDYKQEVAEAIEKNGNAL